MTETFPFGAGDQHEMHPPVDADAADDTGRRPSKRALAIGGGVLALAVLGGGFLLLSGGGGGGSAQALVPHGSPAAHATPGTAGGDHSRRTLPVYRGAPAGRDPFKPLVTAPPPAAPSIAPPPPSPTSIPVVGPGTGPSTSPSSGPGPVTSPTPAPTTPAPTTSAPSVVLVFKGIAFTTPGNVPVVDVTFNGKAYRLKSGGTIGTPAALEVLSIQPDDSIAVFQVGDQTFDLHVGQAWLG